MNFREMLDQVSKIKDAILEGRYAEAWELTIPLQQKFVEFAKDIGFRAGPDDMENAKKLQEALQEAKAACDATRSEANQPVGKIGDGQILKLLIEAFLKFAPLFFQADPNQPINEASSPKANKPK